MAALLWENKRKRQVPRGIGNFVASFHSLQSTVWHLWDDLCPERVSSKKDTRGEMRHIAAPVMGPMNELSKGRKCGRGIEF